MKILKIRHSTVFLVIISLIIGVVVYLATGTVNLPITPTPLPPAASASASISLPPTAINIPKINKNLPIKFAIVRGNDWDLFEDAVAWLSTSAVPGEGNVILYAHNWNSLWADLYLLTPGDTIEVQQNNLWKTYRVTQSHWVGQHDIESVLSKDNRLTLFTCEGNFDQKRRVVYADPIK